MPRPRQSGASKAHKIIKIIVRALSLLLSLAILALFIYAIVEWKAKTKINIPGLIAVCVSVLIAAVELGTQTTFSSNQLPLVMILDFLSMGLGVAAVFVYGTGIWDSTIDLETEEWVRIERWCFRGLEAFAALHFIFFVWGAISCCVKRKRSQRLAREDSRGMPMY